MSIPGTTCRRATVAIVEDEPCIAEPLKIALEEAGFSVIVSDGSSFNDFLASFKKAPCVFVCDMKLPGGSGADLCRMMADRFPSCEIIVMTGAIDVSDAIALRNGFQLPVLLRKPFSLECFLRLVSSLSEIRYSI